jgi:hypothetical protein
MTILEQMMDTNAYNDALFGWGPASKDVVSGDKIRVTFKNKKPKTGYAYKTDGQWLGIRYTATAMRWWILLSYNNPLLKLEKFDNGAYVTIWEAGA